MSPRPSLGSWRPTHPTSTKLELTSDMLLPQKHPAQTRLICRSTVFTPHRYPTGSPPGDFFLANLHPSLHHLHTSLGRRQTVTPFNPASLVPSWQVRQATKQASSLVAVALAAAVTSICQSRL